MDTGKDFSWRAARLGLFLKFLGSAQPTMLNVEIDLNLDLDLYR